MLSSAVQHFTCVFWWSPAQLQKRLYNLLALLTLQVTRLNVFGAILALLSAIGFFHSSSVNMCAEIRCTLYNKGIYVTGSEKRDHFTLFHRFFNFWQFSRYHISAIIIFGSLQQQCPLCKPPTFYLDCIQYCGDTRLRSL